MALTRYSVLKNLAFVALLLIGVGLLPLTQAQDTGETFEDADPGNDPNYCRSDPDPENCDWQRGWYQAAVDEGHISLRFAREIYPDMQTNGWLNTQESRDLELFLDDDPSNDPNACRASTDPNCDWNQGWYQSSRDVVTYLNEVYNVKYGQISSKGVLGASILGKGVLIVTSPSGGRHVYLGVSAEIREQFPELYEETSEESETWSCAPGTYPDPAKDYPNCDLTYTCPEGTIPDFTKPLPNCDIQV